MTLSCIGLSVDISRGLRLAVVIACVIGLSKFKFGDTYGSSVFRVNHNVLWAHVIIGNSLFPGMFLWMHQANERRYYIVTLSLIGWVHAQKDPCVSQRPVTVPCIDLTSDKLLCKQTVKESTGLVIITEMMTMKQRRPWNPSWPSTHIYRDCIR